MRKISIYLIVFSIILLFCSFVYLYYFSNYEITKFLQLLSGFSTFVVALLTAIYVYTTNCQLSTMERQLEEMNKSRLLENQPFPWIDSLTFIITPPKVYYYPPRNRVSLLSIYKLKFKTKNIGKGPAVGVYIDPKFIMKNEETVFSTEEPCKILEVIEEGHYFDSKKAWFNNPNEVTVNNDREYLALKHLLKAKTLTDFPVFNLTIYYKNFMGAAFSIDCNYMIMPTLEGREDVKKQLEVVKDWYTRLSDAKIKLDNLIKQTEDTYQIDKILGRKKFLQLEETFKEIMNESREEDLEMPVVFSPSNFKVSSISLEEYNLVINLLLKDDERRRYG